MIKVPITFQTLTPLFTGNHDQKMTEIKPASIMGSLRFWFEVICHFSNKFTDIADSKNKEKIADTYNNLALEGTTDEEEMCKRLYLNPTEFYFGTTGWKSQIGIDNIVFDYQYIKANDENNISINGKIWYPPTHSYQGEFLISFNIKEIKLINNILFPLLHFIQEYGFLGGKNNLGFGRVSISSPITKTTKLSVLNKTIDYSEVITNSQLKRGEIENKNTFSWNKMEAIWLLPDNKPRLSTKSDNPFVEGIEKYEQKHFTNTITDKDTIKNLLKIKAEMRRNITEENERHYIFGSTQRIGNFSTSNGIYCKDIDFPNATKIIPLIRNDSQGFLAIPGIVKMKETDNE